ncbi:uncharacterized protein BBA_10129 [Beauveria bassiana ARSEF 2860]|uniref:Uncharacterized protein n=1 Tax=Beauveria bassiana (strain ARSEF 2860) TaxID=655819 RepID=J4UEZ0_BEAB2|nr:uncharacterized protein BBA_10129 [Beauveria bassiana ARSEF 2860]EJP60922.1 hypothetical protein BBA_10129 [Beauveria bassiana ARSEF 2860]
MGLGAVRTDRGAAWQAPIPAEKTDPLDYGSNVSIIMRCIAAIHLTKTHAYLVMAYSGYHSYTHSVFKLPLAQPAARAGNKYEQRILRWLLLVLGKAWAGGCWRIDEPVAGTLAAKVLVPDCPSRGTELRGRVARENAAGFDADGPFDRSHLTYVLPPEGMKMKIRDHQLRKRQVLTQNPYRMATLLDSMPSVTRKFSVNARNNSQPSADYTPCTRLQSASRPSWGICVCECSIAKVVDSYDDGAFVVG